VCTYTHTCVFFVPTKNEKKVVENVFSAKVTKLCTTHTYTHTHTDIQKHARICNFLKTYYYYLIRTISYAYTTHAKIKSIDFHYSGVARAWYICRSYFTKFFPHLYFFHLLPATLLAKRRVFGAVLVSVLPDQSTHAVHIAVTLSHMALHRQFRISVAMRVSEMSLQMVTLNRYLNLNGNT